MLGELWTFSVRSLNGAWVLYRLNLPKWLFFVHCLEVKRNPIPKFNPTPFISTKQQDHTSQDHFCSVIDEFPVWNSEPDQTMMMRWATFPEREKVLRLLSGDSKHWWSLATPLWAANGSVAVWVVMNQFSWSVFCGFTTFSNIWFDVKQSRYKSFSFFIRPLVHLKIQLVLLELLKPCLWYEILLSGPSLAL